MTSNDVKQLGLELGATLKNSTILFKRKPNTKKHFSWCPSLRVMLTVIMFGFGTAGSGTPKARRVEAADQRKAVLSLAEVRERELSDFVSRFFRKSPGTIFRLNIRLGSIT